MYNADPSVTSYLYYHNISDLQLQTLLNYAPVGVLIYADSGFMSYSSGVYSGCPAFETSYNSINHAVILIGYDASGNWIIKNQWNTGWGESGFATISGTNNCALNAWVYQYSSTTPFSGSTSYVVTSFFTTKF
jgi:C1A family cysteine protease